MRNWKFIENETYLRTKKKATEVNDKCIKTISKKKTDFFFALKLVLRDWLKCFFPFLQFQLVFRWFFPISCAFESSESQKQKKQYLHFGNRKRQVYIESIERDIVCRNTIYGACHHTRLDRPKHTTQDKTKTDESIAEAKGKIKFYQNQIVNLRIESYVVVVFFVFYWKSVNDTKAKWNRREKNPSIVLSLRNCSRVSEWEGGRGRRRETRYRLKLNGRKNLLKKKLHNN